MKRILLAMAILLPSCAWSFVPGEKNDDRDCRGGNLEYVFQNGRKILYQIEKDRAMWADNLDPVIPASPRLIPVSSLGKFFDGWNEIGEPHWTRFATQCEESRPVVHMENAYNEVYAVFQSGDRFGVPIVHEHLDHLYWKFRSHYTQINDWDSYDFQFDHHQYAVLVISERKRTSSKVYLNRDDGWAIELATIPAYVNDLGFHFTSGKLKFRDEKNGKDWVFDVPDVRTGHNMHPKPMLSHLYEALKQPIQYEDSPPGECDPDLRPE
jgi:hypothetical protein